MIGVSKRCCPTCRHLLLLLAKDHRLPFIVKGSHSTVTGCTIPPWLPSEVVDRMNEIFGGQLRRELIKIYGSSLTQTRSASTGSRRLSSDIGHEVGGTSTPSIPNLSASGFKYFRIFSEKIFRASQPSASAS